MKKFVIIGMGQFGRALVRYLSDRGYEVSILDEKESVIDEIKDEVSCAIIGDATDIRVLRQLDLVGDDIYVIVAVGEQFERNLLITAQLRELGVKHLYVRGVNELHLRVLKLIGIGKEELFRVEDVAARQLAFRLATGCDRVKIAKDHALVEVALPKALEGKKLSEVGLRAKYKLNLLTVRREGAKTKEGKTKESDRADFLSPSSMPVIGTPDPEMVFQPGDVLVLFGSDSDHEEFSEQINKLR